MKKNNSSEKSKRNEKIKDPAKIKTGITAKPEPVEENIRTKANEIYLQRIERGESGTAEKDWFEAERYLRVED